MKNLDCGESAYQSDVLIIGTGLAGLFAALKLYPLKVSMVSSAPLMTGASSAWAQGGIAAVLSPDDTIQAHVQDTMIAGCYLNNLEIVNIMASEALCRVQDLASMGIQFDCDSSGNFIQGREAAHSANRIVRVGGDGAGRFIIQKLTDNVLASEHINVHHPYVVFDLARNDSGTVIGVYVRKLNSSKSILLRAPHIIMATGGIGSLYQITTNPYEIKGEGLGIAARHGAYIKDAEFVQFHPTALDIGKTPAPLVTEALRGEGARLVNDLGTTFMDKVHPDSDLAPRDIVARAVALEHAKGHKVFLDCREQLGGKMFDKFPIVTKSCLEAGIDPVTMPIPIRPAQHYHMGGIYTDEFARTTLDNLFAIGEVACTGAHGANRLASNSLLEALVFSARAAEFILNQENVTFSYKKEQISKPVTVDRLYPKKSAFKKLRMLMTEYCGLLRSQEGLLLAQKEILELDQQGSFTAPFTNYAHAALSVIQGALIRKKSIGAHFRVDEETKIIL